MTAEQTRKAAQARVKQENYAPVPMLQSIHGAMVEARLPTMPCGGTPLFDSAIGCAYRCDTCFAVIGSLGQSNRCKEINRDTP